MILLKLLVALPLSVVLGVALGQAINGHRCAQQAPEGRVCVFAWGPDTFGWRTLLDKQLEAP